MYTPPPGGPPGSAMSPRARLRPMGIGDILDETFRLYRENFTLFVGTCAIVEVPLQIVLAALSVGMVSILRPVTDLRGLPAGSITAAQASRALSAGLAAGGLGLVIGLLVLLAVAFVGAALAVVISNRYLERATSVGMAYQAALQRLGPFLIAIMWAFIRLIPFILISAVLIGLPFLFYFFVAWTLIPQAIMLEGESGLSASRRSRQLIGGYWWKTFGLIIVTAILLAILSAIPVRIVDALIGSGSGSLTALTIVNGIISLIVGVLTRPIQTTAMTLLFYDLKIRKEAFDLEALVQQAGLAAPPSPTYY